MKLPSLELIRRVVATLCITFVAALFWAFMIAGVLRYALGIIDQGVLDLIIYVTALCIGAIFLPKFWRLMGNY